MKDAAVAYAKHGLSVHALPPGSKKASTPWIARTQQRLTPEEVEALWSRHPHANIAIVTGRISGVVVVDIDPAHGGDPGPFVAQTPVVATTRSGGWHCYFRWPNRLVRSVATPNPARPGVDVRGDGGYVVAPPSRVPPGEYVWATKSILEVAINELPSFDVVSALLEPPSRPVRREMASSSLTGGGGERWLHEIFERGVPIGEQRQALTRVIGYLIARGLPPDVIVPLCWSHLERWPQHADDPWRRDQLEELVQSLYAREGWRAGVIDSERAAEGTLLEAVHIDAFIERYAGHGVEWLVEDWLPMGTIAMVQSPPGAYKTWLLCELAVSAAGGSPFLGQYPVHRSGPVLYIQQEDPRAELAARLGVLLFAKDQVRHGAPAVDVFYQRSDSPPLYLATDMSFAFDSRPARQALVQRLEELRPHLVILDPLYTACPAGQFFVEMPGHLRWVRQLRDRYQCSFIFAHHTRKVSDQQGDAGREQLWGSNLLNAAIETGWIVRPAGEDQVKIRRHFKVAASIETRRFQFSIDIDAPVPFRCIEIEDADEGGEGPEASRASGPVAPEEPPLTALDRQILEVLTRAGRPVGQRPLARQVDRALSVVQRRLKALERRGLVAKELGGDWVRTAVQWEDVS